MPLILTFAIVAVAGASIFLLQRCSVHIAELKRLRDQLALQARELQEAEERERLMFSANPYPMWVYDVETLRFVLVNDAAVQSYGYSREEFLQMTILDIRPPEDSQAALERVNQRHAGLSDAGIWRHRRKDGSFLHADVRVFRFQNHGRPQVLVTVTDISERVKMEDALRQSHDALQKTVDNAPFGIGRIRLDQDRFEMANPALLEMLGSYSPEEAARLKLSTQVYGDSKERERLFELLRRNRRIRGFETTFLRRGGAKVRVRLSGSLVNGSNGAELYDGYVEDLTEQSSLEQQVRQVQKLEAVGRLAGGMAHDFNNVLVVIKLSTELMLGQITPDSPLSKPLLQVSNAADRAAALTRQMLAFGRQQIMQARILNLNSVVSETTHMLRRIIGEDIELVTKLADRVHNSRLDPDQVAQVILNLAVNARDAMPGGGTLHIETANIELDDAYTRTHPPVQPGSYVMLVVSDTGFGIDKAILPRIFDPFFTTKEVGKGTGLGLSIVYGIVKQSGGYIWVYSEPGHGTTFKLYFPATNAPIEMPLLRAGAAPSPTGQTVLLVEDEAIIRGNVRECLQQLGYRVLEAENGKDALELCESHRGSVDLVLTDLVMPGMGGHQLASELAVRYPEVRMLFMSGYTEDSAARRDILLQGSAFLQKPFSVADLSHGIRQALELRAVPT